MVSESSKKPEEPTRSEERNTANSSVDSSNVIGRSLKRSAEEELQEAPGLKHATKERRELLDNSQASNELRGNSAPEPSRQRRRPGNSAKVSRAATQAVFSRQRDREASHTAAIAQARGVDEVVRQHYNAVPERGREWRRTASRIKGLRSFNNWVKSTMIHKFSPQPEEDRRQDLLNVLDIGCGKGGDLGKWAQAPQPVGMYIGIDPAEVSIEQAKDRYAQMRPRSGGGGGSHGRGGFIGKGPRGSYERHKPLFEAAFLAEDAFAYSLGDLPLIRQVGFGPGARWGPSGGFDVVSMMFCMHYAYETEAKAKGMLNNVANCLRKGGRFIGVIPNSDVIREGVIKWHQHRNKSASTSNNAKRKLQETTPPFIPPSPKRQHELEKSSENLLHLDRDGHVDSTKSDASRADDEQGIIKHDILDLQGPGDKEATPRLNEEGKTEIQDVHPTESKEAEDISAPTWGNDLYSLRFPPSPPARPSPADGIFRPPYGWKYSFFLHEAVEEVPEYIVPWEGFRAIAEDYNLELQYRKPFREIWEEEGNSPVFGPLSERMEVRGRDGGPLLVTPEEMEVAGFYHAFCFYKV